MTNTAATAPLLRRIRERSETAHPIYAGTVDPDNLEATMQADAERKFQQALLERTFWNLTPDERDRIRMGVLAGHPEYCRSMFGPSFDLECVRDVARVLEQAAEGC